MKCLSSSGVLNVIELSLFFSPTAPVLVHTRIQSCGMSQHVVLPLAAFDFDRESFTFVCRYDSHRVDAVRAG